MTIEPAAVRFNFGTSVRTWAQDAPQAPIIANLFRDVNEPNDGLTQKVEVAAAYLMRIHAERDGHAPERALDLGANNIPLNAEITMTVRMRNVLVHLGDGKTLNTLELAELARLDRDTILKMCYRMIQRGAVTSARTNHNKATLFTITDIGRRALETGRLPAAKDDAE